jgi:hypothetical protein
MLFCQRYRSLASVQAHQGLAKGGHQHPRQRTSFRRFDCHSREAPAFGVAGDLVEKHRFAYAAETGQNEALRV